MRPYEIYNARKRRLTRLADALLGVLPRPQSSPLPPPRDVRELLVMRTAYLGDVAMALPALRALRRAFAASRITLLTSRAGRDLAAPEGVADEILVFEPRWFYGRPRAAALPTWRQTVARLRSRPADLGIDLRGDLRDIAGILWPSRAARRVAHDVAGGGPLLTDVVPYPGRGHKVDLMLHIARHVGAVVAEPSWGLAPRDAGRAQAEALLSRSGIRGTFLLVHRGTRVALKRYGLLAAAEERLRRETKLPVLSLSGDEPELGVDGLVELVRAAAVLLCHDSAPWHVAQAVATPAVAVFGPSKPWATGLYPGRPGRALSRDLPCRDACDETRCHLVDTPRACLDGLPVGQVVDAVREVLAAHACRVEGIQ